MKAILDAFSNGNHPVLFDFLSNRFGIRESRGRLALINVVDDFCFDLSGSVL